MTTILRPLLLASGQRRSGASGQVHASGRAALPAGTAWFFVTPVTVVTAAHTWTLPAAVPALLWDTATQAPTMNAALDFSAHAYLLFCLENEAALYAVAQEDWAAVAPAGVVCPLAWAEAHLDLVPRLAARPRGEVWMTDQIAALIVCLDFGGTVLGTITSDEFSLPYGMSLVDDEVWVANQGNGTVTRLTRSGAAAGAPLTHPDLFSPYNILVVGDAVWVSDSGTDAIVRLNHDGTPHAAGTLHYTPSGSHEVQYGPGALLQVADTVWVCGTRVLTNVRFTLAGAPIDEFFTDGEASVQNLALASDSTVWGTYQAADTNGVLLFDTATRTSTALTASSLWLPCGVAAVGPEMWVANAYSAPLIARFRPDTSPLVPAYDPGTPNAFGLLVLP